DRRRWTASTSTAGWSRNSCRFPPSPGPPARPPGRPKHTPARPGFTMPRGQRGQHPRTSGLGDLLLDGAEDAAALAAQHLDADHVAEAHEGRAGLAVAQGLDRTLLGEAAGALAGVLVGHGAGA